MPRGVVGGEGRSEWAVLNRTLEFAGEVVGVADGPGGSTWVRERGTGIPWGTLSPNVWWTGLYSLGDVEPAMFRVLASCEEAGAGDSGRVLVNNGRESSAVTAGLSLELRDSCVVSTTAAVWIPSFAGPMLPPVVRASCDERGWRRQERFEAGSRCDGPVGIAEVLCREPEPLMPLSLIHI